MLNADDPHVAAVAGLVRRADRLLLRCEPEPSPVLRGARRGAAGEPTSCGAGRWSEVEAGETRPIVDIDEIPATLGGLARHNVANALAAAGGARAMGATIEQVADGLRDFRPSADRSPGRLNLFRHGKRVVIVDFAHNEAGLEALLDVADGIAAGGAARTWPVTLIIGTAGDRPDDTIRGIGRIAGARARRVAIKETPGYLRGRDRARDDRRAPGRDRRGRGGGRRAPARPAPSIRPRSPSTRPRWPPSAPSWRSPAGPDAHGPPGSAGGRSP